MGRLPDGAALLERTRNEGTLTTPLYLAAVGGHGAVVALLLGFSLPPHDAFAACRKAVHVAVVQTPARIYKPRDLRPLIKHWLTQPNGHRQAELLLFLTKAPVDAGKMILAAQACNASAVKLLVDCGQRANATEVAQAYDKSVYHTRSQKYVSTRTAMHVALRAYQT